MYKISKLIHTQPFFKSPARSQSNSTYSELKFI